MIVVWKRNRKVFPTIKNCTVDCLPASLTKYNTTQQPLSNSCVKRAKFKKTKKTKKIKTTSQPQTTSKVNLRNRLSPVCTHTAPQCFYMHFYFYLHRMSKSLSCMSTLSHASLSILFFSKEKKNSFLFGYFCLYSLRVLSTSSPNTVVDTCEYKYSAHSFSDIILSLVFG